MSSGEGGCRGLYGPNISSSDLTITNKSQRQIPRMLQNGTSVQDAGKQSCECPAHELCMGMGYPGHFNYPESLFSQTGRGFFVVL